jgi:beta-galactosidase
MTRKSEGSGSWMTRRDVLAQAAMGAVAASVSPYLAGAQGLPAQGKTAPRSRDSFDFGWKFLQGDAAGAQLPNFADAGWRDVDLPHDWSIEGPVRSRTRPAAARAHTCPPASAGIARRFRVPAEDRDRVAVLEFDGVYQNSEVWINGQYLGLRPYGFVPFAYELTPHLKFDAENVVAVKVDNSRQTNCRWYSGSGIYRHTWLPRPIQLRVAHWGTFVTAPHVSRTSAIVEVKTRIANDRNARAMHADDGARGQGRQGGGTQEASQTVSGAGRIRVRAADRGGQAEPLVAWRIRISTRCAAPCEAGQVVDVYDTPSAFARRVFDARRGFLLNGEHIKLNGACIHQEAGCVGSAVRSGCGSGGSTLLQEMGCNAIRTSHNPYAAEFLDLCDRMGFLVMNEAFDEWKWPRGRSRTATTSTSTSGTSAT